MKPMQTTNVDSEADAGIPNILEVLDGLHFPATQVEIVDYAQDRNASDDVLNQLRAMPERYYDSIREVSKYMARIGDQTDAARI